jgi:hypothetical protein
MFSWYNIYEIEYFDLEGVRHTCSIAEYTTDSIPITINGYVTYNLSEVDDVDESIRGSGLTLSLEASTSRTFSDLTNKPDKYWKVTYTRDGATFFIGWLITDGIYEDFVADKWIIDLDVTDGLSYLTDLSYVDSDGLQFSGKQTQLEIISNCLNRIGIDQNINTNIDIYYTGLSTSLDVLDNVNYNVDRFIKDDEETIMSCEEVLRDILEPYNAQIVSWNGEWWIYKLNQLYADDTPTFFSYSYLGVALSPTTTTEDFSFSLGSQIDSYYPHHANANQVISYKKSIGAYRISYKYGVVQSLLANILLENVSGTIADWTINDYTNLTLNASNYGVDILTIADGSEVKNMTSDIISLSAGDLISYTYKYKVIENDKLGGLIDPGVVNYKIILTDGVSTYYWNITDWATFDVMLTNPIGNLGSISTISYDLTALPIAGDVTFEIHTSTKDVSATSSSKIHIQEISLTAQQVGNEANLKGEFHTFQREDNPSNNVKDTKKVNVGDNPSDIYYGTIYKADATTPTETWFRKGVTEAKPILELMGEETMMLSQNTAREFTGDVYGIIEPLSIITINNITGFFTPLSLDYDSKRNITNIKLREVFNTTLTDLSYEVTYDYGNTVKPTIKG